MPPNTIRVHTEYVLVKSVGPKSCGLSHERRVWRIFLSPSVHAEIVEVEVGGVAIYRPFGKFRRGKSYCHLYGAQGQRQAYFLFHATMNFVGLDLTETSDRAFKNVLHSKFNELFMVTPPEQVNPVKNIGELLSAAYFKADAVDNIVLNLMNMK
ncbi:uncharacterized protein TNCV_4680631 [Trichonephila clavipes]|nr:uncharacterized protein TNCV_4680631 [Trichonephila clavipes]